MSMVLTEQLKTLIEKLAETVKEIYQFSLLPTAKNYKDIETIVNDLGGGLIFQGFDTEVCRCGTSFMIKMPNEKDKTSRLRCFAEGLAILFLELKYKMSDEEFMGRKNMSYETIYRRDYEDYKILEYLTDEFLCPREELRKAMVSILHDDGTFCIKDLVPLLGLNYSYIEHRLVQCHMIKGMF